MADLVERPHGEHSDEADLDGLARYLAECREGLARYSVTGAAKAMGVSRAYVYRVMSLSEVSDEEFDDILDGLDGNRSMTAVADAVKRRTGKAREYEERCPHCGETLRLRYR